jgi:hypothetical protein
MLKKWFVKNIPVIKTLFHLIFCILPFLLPLPATASIAASGCRLENRFDIRYALAKAETPVAHKSAAGG